MHCLGKIPNSTGMNHECSRAFNFAKQSLMSKKVLVHFDPSLPLRLAGDASSYDVGAVIS